MNSQYPQINTAPPCQVLRGGGANASITPFSHAAAQQARSFHRSIPGYRTTPLVSLSSLAKYAGVKSIWVKDESRRFGLNAFKVLGASYALAGALAERIGMGGQPLRFSFFDDPGNRKKAGEITCITATDGNHGRAVAWAASRAGCRSIVLMPAGSSPVRLRNIQACGADASMIDGHYDDAVELASKRAGTENLLLIQDTAGSESETLPLRIMQGYLTILDETFEQLGGESPTHVFLQCGVGSFPAALTAWLVQRDSSEKPFISIVEPVNADCFYQSALARDGLPRQTAGDLNTIMAGLACGKPNPIAWTILRDHADMFISCTDHAAMTGMRVLGNPLSGDDRIVSGESGAVTTGLLLHIMRTPGFEETRESLELNGDSKILLISTEGDTDPDMYRRIVWGEFV